MSDTEHATVEAVADAPIRQRYARAIAAIVIGLALFGFAFRSEVSHAIKVWIASTAYDHCFLVLPIAAWLFWDRRYRLDRLSPEPFPLAIPLAAVFAIVWFLAQRLGVMEGRQLAAMAMLQALLLGVLGPRIYRAMIAPFLYLFFLVPFGGFLVPALQHFTTEFAARGLVVLGVPNFVHGNEIEIAQGTFRIAQACAGLRFLIAAIAFSVLYSLLIFRSLWKRLTFIAISLFVPVIANGFRALGIVWLGHALGSAQAAATDHVLYGYLFFSIVLALLILLGLPFREDAGDYRTAKLGTVAPTRRSFSGPVWLPAIGVGSIAMIVSIAGTRLDLAAARHPFAPPSRFATCKPLSGATSPRWVTRGGRLARFSCDGGDIVLSIVAFPRQIDPEPVVDTQRRLGGLNWREVHMASLRLGGNRPAWTLAISRHGKKVVASILKLDGHLSEGTLRARTHMVLNEVFGEAKPAFVLAARTSGPAAAALPRLRDLLGSAAVAASIDRLGNPESAEAAPMLSEGGQSDHG